MSEKPNPREVLYQQRPDLAPSWATRIPAAIKRAEEVGDVYLPTDPVKDTATSPRFMLTVTETALAEALWEVKKGFIWMEGEPPLALIAFVEKVESLDA